MKTILTTLCLAGCLTAQAQNALTIQGTASEQATKVYLLALNNLDSATVTKGKFTFQTTANPMQFATLFTKHSTEKPRTIILDENVTIDLVQGKIVKGSAQNQKLATLQDQFNVYENEISNVIAEAQKIKNPDSITIKTITEKYMKANGQFENFLKQTVNENTDNQLPAYFISKYLRRPGIGKEDLIAFCEGNKAYLANPIMKDAIKRAGEYKLTAPGAAFIDFTMADSTGVNHKLSDYIGKGQYVLLDFWASWCGPCIAEIPNVKKAYEKYHAKGFEIVSISLDNKAESWKGAIVKYQLPWKHLSDLKGWQCEGARLYGVRSIPTMVLYGPDGKVVSNSVRGAKLFETLKNIYGE